MLLLLLIYISYYCLNFKTIHVPLNMLFGHLYYAELI